MPVLEFVNLLARQVAGDTAGEAPAGYPYSSLQHVGFFILFFFPSLALLVVGLRVYSRLSTKQFGLDDALIIVAMCISIAETGASYMGMRTAYLGVHNADIPPTADFTIALRWNYVLQLLYNPILAIVKTSVLMFLLRLGSTQRRIRYSIYALNAFNIGLAVGIFITVIFQCHPIDYFWKRANPLLNAQGTCINMGAFYVATAGLTILTDVLVLALPMWIFVGLKMPVKVKIALLFVFLLGAIVTVFSCLRLAWLVETSFYTPGPDNNHDIRFTYSGIETNLAIMCASAPAMRGLFLRWFPRLFSSLGYGSKDQRYYYGANGNRYPASGSHRYGASSAAGRGGGGGGGVVSALRSKHHRDSVLGGSGDGNDRNGGAPYALRDLKWRSEVRSHSPTASEEEIMTSNGIMRTTEVQVAYGEGNMRHERDDGKFGYTTTSTGSL